MKKKIRVLIVEDSLVIRTFLEYIVGGDPRLEMAGAVGSAEEALAVLEKISPDVISMDIRLPGMNGFEATQHIMTRKPTPIVVVASSVEAEDMNIAGNALRAGALTVLEKPVGATSANYQALGRHLCTQLAIMSQVNVVRRRRPFLGARPAPPPPAGYFADYRALGIVSSTGGPSAVVQLLNSLGADFPLPVFLVQHIAASFLHGFANWLRGACPFSVKIVDARENPEGGTVYLAEGGRHLLLGGPASLETGTGSPVSYQRPSGTVLFESMARSLGERALGVLLTGMGDDGAQGLLQIRLAGGYTIAEDESTAVVYGMPAQAVALGGACESLPLPAIGPRLLELAKPKTLNLK